MNDNEEPSSTELAAGVIVGVNDTSVIDTLENVATTVPDELPLRKVISNVSVPSVLRSLVGVTVKLPLSLFTTNVPNAVPKSPELLTDQYTVVPSNISSEAIFTVRVPPSLMMLAVGVMLYAVHGLALSSPTGVISVAVTSMFVFVVFFISRESGSPVELS